MNLDAFIIREFPVLQHVLYLNHAGIGTLPRRTADAINSFAQASLDYGARDYPVWLTTEQRLREALATLINAPSSSEIALIKNTSEGLSMVAHGFPWKRGDNVVISDEEFPSNRMVWESLHRYGVRVKEADLSARSTPVESLLAACDEHTRMIAVSSVQFASGVRTDLKELGHACRERDIVFCVDAIQAVGCVKQDVQSMNIDFLVADGHKWMLAPEGLGVFYCSSAWLDRLQLFEYGWHMREQSGEHDRKQWEPAASARRFECGSPNLLGAHALLASVELLLDIGMEEIQKRVLARSEYLFKRIQEQDDLELLTDPTPGRYAGIVTFRSRNENSAAMFKRLRDNQVICAERLGGIRFSPHFYTPFEHLDRALGLI